ncbi:MAG: hypothetical protein K0B07_03730 [DPANN group archaeon]|nr:hypothetical protein [DPANN group archaeon]
MSKLEMNHVGAILGGGYGIPVDTIGSPDPTDYISFDVLVGATVLSCKGNWLRILKDGNKEDYFLGESNDVIYLSESETKTKVTCYDIPKNKMVKDPLSYLKGLTIEKVFKSYFSSIDESKDLPWSVIFETHDGIGYNLTGDDMGVLIYINTFENLMNQIILNRINRT